MKRNPSRYASGEHKPPTMRLGRDSSRRFPRLANVLPGSARSFTWPVLRSYAIPMFILCSLLAFSLQFLDVEPAGSQGEAPLIIDMVAVSAAGESNGGAYSAQLSMGLVASDLVDGGNYRGSVGINGPRFVGPSPSPSSTTSLTPTTTASPTASSSPTDIATETPTPTETSMETPTASLTANPSESPTPTDEGQGMDWWIFAPVVRNNHP